MLTIQEIRVPPGAFELRLYKCNGSCILLRYWSRSHTIALPKGLFQRMVSSSDELSGMMLYNEMKRYAFLI